MKRIELNERVKALIKASVGDDINYDSVAVFEATAVTSLPLNKRGTIFDKGQITAETFQEAATLLNTGGFVPLHTLHEQGYEIPVGRVFHGESLKAAQGFDELRVLFFVDDTSPQLISRLDNGTLEEVSVGMQFKRLLCSTCSVDLMEDPESMWSLTCKNGHVMGMGTNHIKPDGVANFRELSLVSKGASNGAKVLGAQKRLLASAYYKEGSQLAASLKDPEFVLFGSPTKPTEEDPEMIAELQAKLAEAEQKLAELTSAKTAADVQVAELTAAKTAADAQVAELTSAKTAADVQVAELTSAKTAADVQVAELTSAKTAADVQVAELTASVAELKPLKESQEAQVAQRPFKIPLGGVADLQASKSDASKNDSGVLNVSRAFKSPKR